MGRHWLSSWVLAFIVALTPFYSAQASDPASPPWESCDCAESSCGACEVEAGTSFYSAKCGPQNARVKSCKKSTCVAVEDQKVCLASLKGGSTNGLSAAASATSNREEAERKPAAANTPAGELAESVGGVRLVRASGAVIEAPKPALLVYAGDLLETQINGRVRIVLKDGPTAAGSSELLVPPSSRVKIEKFESNPASQKRQVMLNLLSGKVRSKVQQKYEGDNSYQVKTRTAVAGVRGTDFLVAFEPNDKEWVSEVKTLEGSVRLESAQPSSGSSTKSAVDVPGGTYAAFVVKAPPKGATDSEIELASAAGAMGPVFKMKDEEAQSIRDWTEIPRIEVQRHKDTTASSRDFAAVDDLTCTSPAGAFNQCSFTCEGGAKGEKVCRTELPTVSCVRRLCRANGQWGEAKRMPASEAGACDPTKVVVRDCGNYW